jgi:hypothetical protein
MDMTNQRLYHYICKEMVPYMGVKSMTNKNDTFEHDSDLYTPIDHTSQFKEGMSKSEKIRRLAKSGMNRWTIHKTLGLRYQFVRNVLEAAGIPNSR